MKTIPENDKNILSSFIAIQNCIKANNIEWENKHRDNMINVLRDILPHGSGIDCKWVFADDSKYIICSNSFHVMDENGYYDGYIDFTVKINGLYRDYNGNIIYSIIGSFGKHQDIKDYLYDIMNFSFENL